MKTDEGATAPEKFGERAGNRYRSFGDPALLRRFATALRLADDQTDENRRQRKARAGEIGKVPADARCKHQGKAARRDGAYPPSIL